MGSDYLDRCTGLAVMGGTFDPIHNGHLAIAEAVLHQFKPQKVLFIPAGKPPHKPDKPVSNPGLRYRMITLAICTLPGIDASLMELERIGPSYTVDTIRDLRESCPSECKIYFIVGQDALENILTWKDAETLLTLCEFIAVPRPGYDKKTLKSLIGKLEKKYGAIIHILKCPMLDISSTYIRECFAKGKPVSALMPRVSEEFARINGLYGTVLPDLSDKHFIWAKNLLQHRLSPKRYKHTLGVVIEAERLAKHYGADITKARWAGLLHDCVKEYSADKKRELCFEWGVEIDEIVASHIDLAHGLLGAKSATADYHVIDQEVLQAIRFHIMGHKDMTLLDKIIVLADFIEPFRDDYYPLREMRELAYVDINKALSLGLTAMRDMDIGRGKKIHHWSQDAIKTLGGK